MSKRTLQTILLQKITRSSLLAFVLLATLLFAFILHQGKVAIEKEGEFLTDMVFASLYNSMKKGWHEDDISKEINRINQSFTQGNFQLHRSNIVKELFGERASGSLTAAQAELFNSEGKLFHSEILNDGEIAYSTTILFDKDCLSCHVNAKAGQRAGLLTVIYPVSSVKVSIYNVIFSNIVIFIFVLVLCHYIYRHTIFKEILTPLNNLSRKISDMAKSREVIDILSSDSQAKEISDIEHHLQIEQQSLIRAHEEIKKISITDSLTKVKNRNVLMDTYDFEVSLQKRHKVPFSIVSIDLNLFKEINDSYGHDCGDAALIHFANILTSKSRSSDTVIRMGGDEFLVFLTGTSQEEAQTFIDKVKLSLLSTPLVWSFTKLTLKASFGIAVYATGTSVDDMLKEADMQMYQDKQRQKQP